MKQFFFYLMCINFIHFAFVSAKTILVTGGAGFIGSHVSKDLLQRGDTVVVVDNFSPTGHASSDRYNQLKQQNIQNLLAAYPTNLHLHVVDICDLKALESVFSAYHFDAVCHLAARAGVRPSMEKPQDYMKTNIIGTINVLQLIKKYNIRHCVLASSSSVYGNNSEGPFIETISTDKQSSPYGASKKALELLAFVYHHLYGISCTCLRFFTVYGPRGRFDMAPFIFIDEIVNGKTITIVGDGSAVRDFTYVADIANGVVRALDNPLGFEVFNLGCGNPVVLKDFIETIEAVVNRKASAVYAAESRADVPFNHADVTKAHILLGYKPQTNIAEGIKKTYDWYIKEYGALVPTNV